MCGFVDEQGASVDVCTYFAGLYCVCTHALARPSPPQTMACPRAEPLPRRPRARLRPSPSASLGLATYAHSSEGEREPARHEAIGESKRAPGARAWPFYLAPLPTDGVASRSRPVKRLYGLPRPVVASRYPSMRPLANQRAEQEKTALRVCACSRTKYEVQRDAAADRSRGGGGHEHLFSTLCGLVDAWGGNAVYVEPSNSARAGRAERRRDKGKS